MLTKRSASALLVLAFFSVAILCVETNRIAARRYATINSRATEKGHPPAGQRKALKRAVYVEDTAPPSAGYPTGWRYLSTKKRRVAAPVARLQVQAFQIAPEQKVSTNLFLSVLNL